MTPSAAAIQVSPSFFVAVREYAFGSYLCEGDIVRFEVTYGRIKFY